MFYINILSNGGTFIVHYYFGRIKKWMMFSSTFGVKYFMTGYIRHIQDCIHYCI